MSENQDIKMRKKSFQGKVESAVWRKGATLRDILDAMDSINAANIDPRQKNALLQRIIDYGQHLSEQIYLGKRQVPESDDNETIKEFNLRMQDSAYSKYHHKEGYGEPPHGEGYYDENGKFVKVDHYTKQNPNSSTRGGSSNPRWHPIPLRDETVSPLPPQPENVVIPVVPPVSPNDNNNGAGVDTTQPTTTHETTKKDKKRRKWPFMLIPIIATVIMARECKSSEPIVKDAEPAHTTLVNPIPTHSQEDVVELSLADYEYLKYTESKGVGILQNHNIEDAEQVYTNCVENTQNFPEELKALVEKYNMGNAKDTQRFIDIENNPQVTVTTLLLLAESYSAIEPIILEQIQNPDNELSPVEIAQINSRCKMAEQAYKKHNNEENANHISTIDYGLYGANKQTGPSVKFNQEQAETHKQLVDNSLRNPTKESLQYY